MTYLIALASICMSLYSVLIAHPFDNKILDSICFPLLVIIYAVLLFGAASCEYKLEQRIELLEKKLEDKEKDGVEK